ncbi:MAG: hypothetical protein IJX62_07595 [Clostridia bacterium]|nr:hypothetical protein [Clostridia bacterium]
MGKQKPRKKRNTYRGPGDAILDSPVATLVMAVVAVLVGLAMILPQGANKPIPREEAVAYTGQFQKYVWGRNFCTVHFEDGNTQEVYPHTESMEFRNRMKSLEEGTTLFLMINPNNGYIAEIRTEDEELLNFEVSQEEIDSYDNGYVGIGVFCFFAAAFLAVYAVGSVRLGKAERQRQRERRKRRAVGTDDVALRPVASPEKGRVLLVATRQGYHILYRRIRHVNELVINGFVYDEKKGVIELEHRLIARVDGHTIAAGYGRDSFSYILFDGKRIAEKKRWI